jgi:hypothetical protein
MPAQVATDRKVVHRFPRLIVRCFNDAPVTPSTHQRCRRFAVPWP